MTPGTSLVLTLLLALAVISLGFALFYFITKHRRERAFFEKEVDLLKTTFKGLASEVLETQSRQFLDLAQTALSKENLQAKNQFSQQQQTFEGFIKPIHEAFSIYQKQIHELEKSRSVESTQIHMEMQRVIETNAKLQKETQNLTQALKRPHVRGRWGEVQLKNCIELAGLSEYCDFELQSSLNVDDGMLRPDLIVRMPGGRKIIADAKTPMDGYLRYVEAATDEQRTIELANHGRQVRDHVKKLSQKSYAESYKDSADFIVLFLPNEAFLYAALETQADLMEFALSRKVLIATPPTLIGLLKVVRFGWNEQKMTENAEKIANSARDLYKKLDDFVDAFTNVGKHLDKAKAEYDKGAMRLNQKVLPQARQFDQYGVSLESARQSGPKLDLPPTTDV